MDQRTKIDERLDECSGADPLDDAARLLDQVPCGVCVIRGGRLEYLNGAAAGLLDIGFDDIPCARLSDLVVADDRDRIAAALERHPPPLIDDSSLEFRIERGTGEIRVICLRYRSLRHDSTGSLIGTLDDITETREHDARLRLTATVFDNSLEGVIICDQDLRIRMVNPAFTVITGYTTDDVLGHSPSILSSGRHGPGFYHEMWEIIEVSGHWEGEIWNRRKNGEVYPEYLSITALQNADGLVQHYLGVFTDITHRKLSDRQLHRLVHYDTLTDLPNRDMFRQQLKSRIVRAMANRRRIAVLYIDIDHFKAINDSFGHAEGDALLQVIAERLKNGLREGDRQRPSDVVARLGGDEFVVLVDDLYEPEHAGRVAEKLLNRVQEPIALGGYTLHMDASLGIAVYPDDAESVDDLLRNADIAMYRAKQTGRGRYHFFTPEMREQARRQLQLRNALHHALALNQFHLVYQPLVGSSDGVIRGFEALLRWCHPELGAVMPGEFIPLLEESGEIERIGGWVIEQAAQQYIAWTQLTPAALRVSVNLSARQLRSGRVVAQIAATLQATGLPPECLEVEITESLAMEDVNVTQRVLSALSELGVRVAIDDFGTGYSSLSYLQNFYLDTLKVDRSFVQRCADNHHDREIIRATVALAHSMGLEVVAEGVETGAQRDFLIEQGVDLLQGYLFSRPVGAGDAGALLEQRGGQPQDIR